MQLIHLTTLKHINVIHGRPIHLAVGKFDDNSEIAVLYDDIKIIGYTNDVVRDKEGHIRKSKTTFNIDPNYCCPYHYEKIEERIISNVYSGFRSLDSVLFRQATGDFRDSYSHDYILRKLILYHSKGFHRYVVVGEFESLKDHQIISRTISYRDDSRYIEYGDYTIYNKYHEPNVNAMMINLMHVRYKNDKYCVCYRGTHRFEQTEKDLDITINKDDIPNTIYKLSISDGLSKFAYKAQS